jgi:hypothetical protein
MFALLKLVPLKFWAMGIAAAAVLAYVGVLKFDLWRTEHALSEVRTQLSDEQAERAIERDKAKDAAIKAGNEYRALEQQWSLIQKEAEIERTKQQTANARVVADLSRQLVGVRNELTEYASGRREPSGDSLEACQRRARAIGDVLGEALRLQDELAGDAEAEAANARSLLAAWPVIPPP